jgi:hypothetical protein
MQVGGGEAARAFGLAWTTDRLHLPHCGAALRSAQTGTARASTRAGSATLSHRRRCESSTARCATGHSTRVLAENADIACALAEQVTALGCNRLAARLVEGVRAEERHVGQILEMLWKIVRDDSQDDP